MSMTTDLVRLILVIWVFKEERWIEKYSEEEDGGRLVMEDDRDMIDPDRELLEVNAPDLSRSTSLVEDPLIVDADLSGPETLKTVIIAHSLLSLEWGPTIGFAWWCENKICMQDHEGLCKFQVILIVAYGLHATECPAMFVFALRNVYYSNTAISKLDKQGADPDWLNPCLS